MNQQAKDALRNNWDQAKSQVQAQFPDVTEDDLTDAEQAADKISRRTGQDRSQVEQSLGQIAQQYQ